MWEPRLLTTLYTSTFSYKDILKYTKSPYFHTHSSIRRYILFTTRYEMGNIASVKVINGCLHCLQCSCCALQKTTKCVWTLLTYSCKPPFWFFVMLYKRSNSSDSWLISLSFSLSFFSRYQLHPVGLVSEPVCAQILQLFRRYKVQP
jgi:hypothetical protein